MNAWEPRQPQISHEVIHLELISNSLAVVETLGANTIARTNTCGIKYTIINEAKLLVEYCAFYSTGFGLAFIPNLQSKNNAFLLQFRKIPLRIYEKPWNIS